MIASMMMMIMIMEDARSGTFLALAVAASLVLTRRRLFLRHDVEGG